MRPARFVDRAIRTAAAAVFCWGCLLGCLVAPALAQAEEAEGGEGASWMMPYALVLLGVALGLMVVLQPSRRRDRPEVDYLDTSED